jgi:Cu/Ag efflux protein CusF
MRKPFHVYAFTLLLAWAPWSAAAPAAQAGGYRAEIAQVDLAEKRVTLKASMGQETMRVAPSVPLQSFKIGDKVVVTFGQKGREPLITRMELVKP